MASQRFYYLLLFALVLGLGACSDSIPRDAQGREEFKAFYEKFQKDSAFQWERVDFDALNVERKMRGLDEAENYTPETWVFQAKPDPKEVEILLEEMGGEFMRERIVYLNSFIIERGYNLNPVTKNWYMTSYSGVNTRINAPSTSGGEEYRRIKDSFEKQGEVMPLVPTIVN